MKKVFTAIFAFLFLFSAVGGAAAYVNAEEDTELAKNCKAAYLCDWHSGTRIYSKNETQHLPIASMCKIMTLVLIMDELESGSLKLDEEIPSAKTRAVWAARRCSWNRARLIRRAI